MKNLVFCLLGLFSVISLFGQPTKKVIKKERDIREEYYVLKRNKKIKEGGYLLKINGDTLINGNYLNNKKVGKWFMYKSRGSLELIYDYDSAKVDLYNYDGICDINNIKQPPICLTGFNALKKILEIRCNFPPEFEVKSLDYKVIVGFTVDSLGNPNDFKIKSSCGNNEFDKQAFKDIKNCVEKEKWLPAIDEVDKPVNYEMSMYIAYYIP